MPQDAFTLRVLCEELNGILKGGKINRIMQPSVDATVFTVYTDFGVKKLLLDVTPSCPRIGLTEKEPPALINASNFCMLLRKHLLSATINGISVVGFDRIVKIDLTPSSQFFDAPDKVIYVELMGRYSNVILTENGKVMGGNRGINFLDNNVRPLISGLPYTLPPVGDKKEPSDESLKNEFSNPDLITAENICSAVQGIALSTAKEIIFRFNEENNRDFFGFFNDFLYFPPKKPCILKENGEVKDVLAFPYKTLKGDVVFYDNLSSAEDAFFGERQAKKKFSDLKTRLLSVVSTAEKKAKKRLAAVNVRIKEAENAEENRIKGELILANIYKLKGGEEKVVLDNYYDGSKVEVFLDGKLSPAKNAENYYKKYNKQKGSLVSLIPQKESADSEIFYLDSVYSEITLSEELSDLKAIEEELTESGFVKKQQVKRGKKQETVRSPRVYVVNDFTVRAGRNNAENDYVTFSAKGSDIWLHAKDVHSSHIVIETGGKTVPMHILKIAAEICAYYSKAREDGKAEIVYCEKKFVKKPKGAKLGFCTYTDFKSITVIPNAHAELQKNKVFK